MICPESQYFDVNTVLRESTAYFLMERDLQQNRDWSWHGNLLLFSLPVSELLSLTEGICWEQPRPFIKFPFPLCDHISPSFFSKSYIGSFHYIQLVFFHNLFGIERNFRSMEGKAN